MAKRKYKRLHYEDRQTIEAMSKQGSSVSDIAEVLTDKQPHRIRERLASPLEQPLQSRPHHEVCQKLRLHVRLDFQQPE